VDRGAPFYGPAAVHQGKDIVQLKILSEPRSEGGGIAWLAKFSPPPGKLIKIVATALSDEHVFNLTGGRVTKSGQPARASGGYTLNPDRTIQNDREAMCVASRNEHWPSLPSVGNQVNTAV
jgi:hypothetical protein